MKGRAKLFPNPSRYLLQEDLTVFGCIFTLFAPAPMDLELKESKPVFDVPDKQCLQKYVWGGWHAPSAGTRLARDCPG